MTEQEKKEFYHCSIQDFVKRFQAKNYTELNEALKDSMKYIARFNLDPNSTKCDLNSLLYIAKNEIIKLIAKKQLEANEENINNIRTNDDGLMVKSFIADPARATAYYLDKNQQIFDNIKGPEAGILPYNSQLKNNATILANTLKSKEFLNNQRDFLNKKSASLELIGAISAKLPDGDSPIQSALKRQKPNIFETILRWTSKEYKVFVKSIEHYQNPNSPLFGQDVILKKFAMLYVRHNFPNLKAGELPTKEQINALTGKAKPRTELAVNIINAINEKERLEDKYRDIDINLKHTVDKYPWDTEKSCLEEQLLKEEQMENAKLTEKANNNLIEKELEYDEKYNNLDVHDAQDLYN